MIERFDCDDDQMGSFVEVLDILGRIVPRFIDAARVEEHHQRRFGAGELVLARGFRAGSEPGPDHGFFRPAEVADDRRFDER